MTAAAMHDALAQIDVAPLDALARLRGDIDVLDQRLQQMEARREDVATAVYTRVRADYEQRRAALEAEARPLREAARAQYAKLHALLSKSESEHESARLDREEIEFRHSLGEFDEAEYRQRIADVDARLGARTEALEQAAQLRARFVAAFGGQDALAADPTAAPATEATQPKDALPVGASTQPLPVLDPDPAATVAMPLPQPPAESRRMDIGATQPMKVLQGDAATARPDRTMIIRSARLVPQNAEAGKITHTVGLKPVVIGSDEQADVRVPGAAGKHAQIRAGMAGYGLSDLGGGVRVNGIKVDQHLLRHDDVIEVAAARFAFREG
jgi:hypothetical protein